MDNLFLTSVISMASLAVFFAAVLAFADKKLKVEEDPTVTKLAGLLPGVNCGACGCLNCKDFAEKLASGEMEPSKCRVVSKEFSKEIYKVLGKEECESVKMIPLVHCAAKSPDKKFKAEYKGIQTCSACDLVFGGSMECTYGCLGFGDCVKACPFGALKLEEGLPKLDIEKCTGCAKCVSACPRGIITMQEKPDRLWYVACNSNDTIVKTRQVCGVGCIACGVCVKMNERGYFTLDNNLSKADYSKQDKPDEITAIQAKCPTKVIKEIK